MVIIWTFLQKCTGKIKGLKLTTSQFETIMSCVKGILVWKTVQNLLLSIEIGSC